MGMILSYLMVVVMAVLGIVPTVYILGSLAVTITTKVYRKIRYGTSLYD